MGGFLNPFKKQKLQDSPEAKISIEKMEQFFEYVRLKKLIGMGTTGWKDTPYRVGNPPELIPAHIWWKNNSQCAYAAIAEDKLQYHYGEKEDFPIWECPVTSDQKHIRYIADLFAELYDKAGLPNSIEVPRSKAAPKNQQLSLVPDDFPNDKIALLKTYLSAADLSNAFYALTETDKQQEIIAWIDWRDEDDGIVFCFEKILKTGSLNAELNDIEEAIGFEIVILYKGEQHKVPYQGNGADRDTTIVTLNEVLAPDYEIRFCNHSKGGDTLAFLPLSAIQWSELEHEFGRERLETCFTKISKGSNMFG